MVEIHFGQVNVRGFNIGVSRSGGTGTAAAKSCGMLAIGLAGMFA